MLEIALIHSAWVPEGLRQALKCLKKGQIRPDVVYLAAAQMSVLVAWPGIQLRCVASHCALHSRQKPFIRELTLSLGGQTPPDQSIAACLHFSPTQLDDRRF